MAAIGVCFPREFPASELVSCARAVERSGADDLWLIEDCFFTTAIPLAAAAVTCTERITVGLGILPAVVRNPAITAMEMATLSGMAPGRVVGGIGHGIQEWMEQIGARRPSPLTALAEVLDAVRSLLRGEEVTVEGRYAHLRGVRLDHPPQPVPPVLAGVVGPKSLALAGQHADGLVLADWPGADYIRAARQQADADGAFQVAVFVPTSVDSDRKLARARIAGELAAAVTRRSATLRALPFFDELDRIVKESGAKALPGLPDDLWLQLGAVGTPDDVAAHLHLLAEAGANRIALFMAPELTSWRTQLDLLGDLLGTPR
jgi:5,10-methylenetetrahydromethanopterin reductase